MIDREEIARLIAPISIEELEADLAAHRRRKVAMRVEFIECDTCKKKHDVQYVLPASWIQTMQRTYHSEEERHFCSLKCLIAWASEKEKEENT